MRASQRRRAGRRVSIEHQQRLGGVGVTGQQLLTWLVVSIQHIPAEVLPHFGRCSALTCDQSSPLNQRNSSWEHLKSSGRSFRLVIAHLSWHLGAVVEVEPPGPAYGTPVEPAGHWRKLAPETRALHRKGPVGKPLTEAGLRGAGGCWWWRGVKWSAIFDGYLNFLDLFDPSPKLPWSELDPCGMCVFGTGWFGPG